MYTYLHTLSLHGARPSATVVGSAEMAGTAAGTAGWALAGCSRPARIAIAAKPPKAAARVRASRVLRVEGACMRCLFRRPVPAPRAWRRPGVVPARPGRAAAFSFRVDPCIGTGRNRVEEGKSGAVIVEFCGRRSLHQKKQHITN